MSTPVLCDCTVGNNSSGPQPAGVVSGCVPGECAVSNRYVPLPASEPCALSGRVPSEYAVDYNWATGVAHHPAAETVRASPVFIGIASSYDKAIEYSCLIVTRSCNNVKAVLVIIGKERAVILRPNISLLFKSPLRIVSYFSMSRVLGSAPDKDIRGPA